MKLLNIFALLSVFFISCTASSEPKQTMTEEIKFFASWSGYDFPRKPQEEISEQEALSREAAYYKAYYQNKKLVKFEKYIGQELVWADEYEYWPNSDKLKKRIDRRADGEAKVMNFNEKGKLIKE